mgnify:CR=1 FL=1
MNDTEYHTKLTSMKEAASKLALQPGEQISDEFFADRKQKINALKKEIAKEINRLEVEDFLQNGPGGKDPE